MDDSVFDYARKLRVVVQKHAKEVAGLDSNGQKRRRTAIESNKDISDHFIKKITELVSNGNNGLPVMYTFRNRRGTTTSSLRTIHSFPSELAEIFNNDKPDDFDFVRDSFDCPEQATCEITSHTILLEVYDKLDTIPKGYPERDTKIKFAYRIPEFLANTINKFLKDHGNTLDLSTKKKLEELQKYIIPSVQKNGSCLVISRIMDGEGYGTDKLHDLFAIYFTQEPGTKELNELIKNTDFHKCLWLTFTAFEDIVSQDRAIFLRSALSVINKSLNDFSDRKRPPAVNMKNLLAGLEKSCERHPSMGCGTRRDDIKIRFVRVEFLNKLVDDESDHVLPHIYLYPPVETKKQLKNVILFSYIKRKTVSKHLLWQWCKSNDWRVNSKPVHHEFQSLFDEIQEKEFGKWLPPPNHAIKGIYTTDKGTGYWKDKNFSKKINTTAAFMVFHKASGIPYGILAFESHVIDAFSNKDLTVFESIAETVGIVLDIADFGNPSIDYSEEIRKAIARYERADLGRDLSNFIYELERLDLDLLHQVIDDNNEDFDEIEDIDKIKNAFKIITEGCSDCELMPKEKGQKSSWARKNKKALTKRWLESSSINKNTLLSFLEAIPSNDNWHARLSSIPRALSMRTLNKPKLRRFPTGFSADAIYILEHEQEISQVIKFSKGEDIEKEKEAYQKYVRYQIPLAARIPKNGYAIENTGKNASETFGVLVSDLVAGQTSALTESIESLIDILVNILSRGRDEENSEKWLEAIQHHFEHNVRRWWDNPTGILQDEIENFDRSIMNQPDKLERVIKSSSRIIKRKNLGENEPRYDGPTIAWEKEGENVALGQSQQNDIYNFFTAIVKFFYNSLPDSSSHSYSDHSLTSLAAIFSAWEQDTISEAGHRLLKKHVAIVHGDLNPQNLTWSESYKNFQIIDFEHTGPGYRYTDQLKLIFSILLNLHQRIITTKPLQNKKDKALQKTATNIEKYINIIYQVSNTIGTNPSKYKELVSNIKYLQCARVDNIQDDDTFLVKLSKKIFCTIFDRDQVNNYLDSFALGFALKCFALKEIKYAIEELQAQDFERIRNWTEIFSKKESDYGIKQLLEEIGTEDFGKNQRRDNNPTSDPIKIFNRDERVSGLTCSFLGYCAVSAGLGLNWIRKI